METSSSSSSSPYTPVRIQGPADHPLFQGLLFLEGLPVPFALLNTLIPQKFFASSAYPHGFFPKNQYDPLHIHQLYHLDPKKDLEWKIQFYRELQKGAEARCPSLAIDDPPFTTGLPDIFKLVYHREICLDRIKRVNDALVLLSVKKKILKRKLENI